jgi:hypothetical protein
MLQLQLIALYDYVCRYYATQPALHFQRMSNNASPAFTDQELMTVYLFGLLRKRHTLRLTYDYITDHWLDWFPQLPSYEAVNYRLNQIGWQFEGLIDQLCQQLQQRPDLLADVRLTDSLPIILSRQPDSAKVAPNLADKSYCATKKLWYHGLKWHVVASDRLGRMPLPERVQLTAASVHDLSALRQQLPALQGGSLVADKAYADGGLRDQLAAEQEVSLHTPIKKAKGVRGLDAADKLYSTYVSRMRQPIESLFRWLIGQVDLQNGSRIRSEKGAILHCMGRLAAALYMLVCYP